MFAARLNRTALVVFPHAAALYSQVIAAEVFAAVSVAKPGWQRLAGVVVWVSDSFPVHLRIWRRQAAVRPVGEATVVAAWLGGVAAAEF